MKNLFIRMLLCGFSFLALNVYAQKIEVSGKVIDSSKEGVIGASVQVKGTNIGTVTDVDGNFSISVPNKNAVLRITLMGMQPQEVTVGNKTKGLVISLSEDSKLLQEVVVVGFGTQKKENLTGAVKSVDTKVLESRPITSAVAGLQGAVAGLNISNDAGGAPGQSLQINIRGVGSIGQGSSSSPLILIDGVEGDLSLVNPNDIANISVLKDAAAASIYGSRAPFGVVLVTTKSGKKGMSVSYNGNIRFQNPLNTPDIVDSYTHAIVTNDANKNSGAGLFYNKQQLDKILAYQRGEKGDPNDEDGKWLEYGTGPRDKNNDEWTWQDATWGNTDWYDVWLKDFSYSQEHNVSMDGGTDKYNYFVSGRYYKQNGLYNFIKDDFTTLSVNGNFNYKVNKYVTFNWNTRWVNESTDKPTVMDGLFFHNLSRTRPTVPLYMPNGEYNKTSLIPALRDGGQVVDKNSLLYNTFKLTVEPVKDWKLYADFSHRMESPIYTRQLKKVYETLPSGNISPINLFEGMGAGELKANANGTFTVRTNPGESYFERMNGRRNYINFSARTDYEKKIKNHYFKVLLGYQMEYYSNENTRVGSNDILSDDHPYIPQSSATVLRSEKKYEWSTLGLFSRLNYSYADRYLLELNFRGDAASRFPEDKRWGYFPSFSVGWNIAQENFFEGLREKGFDMLKLRGSYGSLGNQNTTSAYPYFQQITTSNPYGGYVFDNATATAIQAPNPYSSSITWETIQTTDVGIDVALLSNRLNASFDWYERATKDMIGPSKSLPNVFGAPVPQTNNAELKTKGWEFEIIWRDRVNKDLSYEVSASLSDNTTKVTRYDSPDGSLSNPDGIPRDEIYYQGKDIGEIWGYRVKGIAKSDNEMNDWLAIHPQKALGDYWGGGDLMYENLDNDPEINAGGNTIYSPGDRTIIGNSTPRYRYGFRAAITYKAFDFSMFWQGVGKRDMYFNSSTFFGVGGQWDRAITTDHLDYFRYADHIYGENLDAYYPRPRIDANNKWANDRYLQNASYLRLKNVTIGYNMPKSVKLGKCIKGLRIYVSGENLLTFTNLRCYDPESVSGAGWGEGKTYPMYRTYSAGMNLTF